MDRISPEGRPAGEPRDRHPQYTPDGRWFWDGSRWLHAERPAVVTHRPPGRLGGSRRTWLGGAIAGLLILLLAAAAVVLALAEAGAPPSAQQIFERPFTSGFRTEQVSAVLRSPGVVRRVTGVVQLSPFRATRLSVIENGAPAAGEIDLHGLLYTRPSGERSWRVAPGASPELRQAGWATPGPPADLRYAGTSSVGGVSAWQVTAGGCRWLIATSGGRPLRIDCQAGARSATYTFGSAGVPGAIPAPSPIATRLRSAPTEVAAQIAGVTAKVTMVDPREVGATRPGPSERLVGVYLVVTNTGAQPIAVDPQIAATVSRGFVFWNRVQDALAPALAPAAVAPGQSTQGWVAFLVPASVGALTLRVGEPSETALFSISLGT